MKVIVNGNIFRNFILISILINTVTMGVEHHDQVKRVFSLDENMTGFLTYAMISDGPCLLGLKATTN